MDSTKDWKVGDIVWCRPNHAGCSYYEIAGVVEKITKTGRVRVTGIDIEHVELKYRDVSGSLNYYKPKDPILRTDQKYYLNNKGEWRVHGYYSGYWKKYNGENLAHFFDNGD